MAAAEPRYLRIPRGELLRAHHLWAVDVSAVEVGSMIICSPGTMFVVSGRNWSVLSHRLLLSTDFLPYIVGKLCDVNNFSPFTDTSLNVDIFSIERNGCNI